MVFKNLTRSQSLYFFSPICKHYYTIPTKAIQKTNTVVLLTSQKDKLEGQQLKTSNMANGEGCFEQL